VGADAYHDQPLWLLHAVFVSLRVAEDRDAAKLVSITSFALSEKKNDGAFCRDVLWSELYLLDALSILDLIFCSVADEDGLAAPFDDYVLAEGDCGEVDFDFGLGEDVGGGGHVDEEI
jgi:hypothetical protein